MEFNLLLKTTDDSHYRSFSTKNKAKLFEQILISKSYFVNIFDISYMALAFNINLCQQSVALHHLLRMCVNNSLPHKPQSLKKK